MGRMRCSLFIMRRSCLIISEECTIFYTRNHIDYILTKGYSDNANEREWQTAAFLEKIQEEENL